MAVFELIQVILHEDIFKTIQPYKNAAKHNEVLMFDFLEKSLQKQPKERATPKQLLEHPWVKGKGNYHSFRVRINC